MFHRNLQKTSTTLVAYTCAAHLLGFKSRMGKHLHQVDRHAAEHLLEILLRILAGSIAQQPPELFEFYLVRNLNELFQNCESLFDVVTQRIRQHSVFDRVNFSASTFVERVNPEFMED